MPGLEEFLGKVLGADADGKRLLLVILVLEELSEEALVHLKRGTQISTKERISTQTKFARKSSVAKINLR
jgi:hypothetical protein